MCAQNGSRWTIEIRHCVEISETIRFGEILHIHLESDTTKSTGSIVFVSFIQRIFGIPSKTLPTFSIGQTSQVIELLDNQYFRKKN